MRRLLSYAIIAALGVQSISCKSNYINSLKKNEVIIETLSETSKSWNGDSYSYPKGQAKMILQKIIAKPGFKTPLHMHPQPGIAHLLKGKLYCGDDNDKKITIVAGDSFGTSQGSIHYCEVISKQKAIILVTYAGAEGKALTVKKETTR